LRKSHRAIVPGKSCARAEAVNARKIQGEASCTDTRIKLTVDSGVEIPIKRADALEAPHEIGRAQFGRISIANSDSEARAYVDAAFDAAWRAVEEQT